MLGKHHIIRLNDPVVSWKMQSSMHFVKPNNSSISCILNRFSQIPILFTVCPEKVIFGVAISKVNISSFFGFLMYEVYEPLQEVSINR